MIAVVLITPIRAQAQTILHWADLTTAQIDSLDRAHTALIIPTGIVEAHGPLLPSGAELLHNERLAADIASDIAARPGWTIVMLPSVPLGSGAFNRRAGRAGLGGTLSIRASTLQAVFTDLGDNLGQQGFRFVFVIGGHSDANHDRALDLSGDVFSASYRGFMLHLLGRRGCQADGLEPPPITMYSAAAMTADADSPHGGTLETARFWWVRPDLVDSVAVRKAADVPAKGWEEWTRVAQRADWPGYVGSPRSATLELGEWLYQTERRNCSDLASRFLDGLDERTVPRFGDQLRAYPDVRALLEAQERAETDEAARQKRALARSPARP
jgi:creatinine amidohydrolase/Fe(II)-dependent formamide hydrolase-like protein